MKLQLTAAKVRASFRAILAGWLAAVLVTLPMELLKMDESASGSREALLGSAVVGILVWSLWTFGIALTSWICGGLPLLTLVREEWLLRNTGKAVAIAGLMAWTVVLIKFKIWKLLLPYQSVGPRIFSLYSLFFVALGMVGSFCYLRLRHTAVGVPMRPPGSA